MDRSKIEKIIFYSNILRKEMQVCVYLPKNYEISPPLPVLYFLHGRSGNENIMFEVDIQPKADLLIHNRNIEPLIIVCPRIENSRGINSSFNSQDIPDSIYNERIINLGMYEDYFIHEIIPFIDNTFNTIRDRKSRFVGGASAGGYAALHNAFRHQDLFSKVGGHMPSLELTLEKEDMPYFQDMDTWEKYDPISIARNNKIILDLEVYLDAGDKDEGEFYKGCSILQDILKKRAINSQNHVFPGHHSIEYIKSNIEKYLEFYGKRTKE